MLHLLGLHCVLLAQKVDLLTVKVRVNVLCASLVSLVTRLASNSASNANLVPFSLVTEKPPVLSVSEVPSLTSLVLPAVTLVLLVLSSIPPVTLPASLVLWVTGKVVLVLLCVTLVRKVNSPTVLVKLCAWTVILVPLVTPLRNNSASSANRVPFSLVTAKPSVTIVHVVPSLTTLPLRLVMHVWLVLLST
jgi:hypothetical protein